MSRSLRLARTLGMTLTVPALLTAQPAPGSAASIRVRTVTDTLVGSVGGVAVDRRGIIYVATFGDVVYRVMPDGRTGVFATGLYGASGNAVDSQGRLLQSNFFGNTVARIDRNGNVSTLAEGLQGPVGIAVDPNDDLVVTNCSGNSLSRVTRDGAVSTFAESDLFQCPNGITRGPDGTYYVVNFTGPKLLKVTPEGTVTHLADIPGGGNGHVAIARGNLYVTAFQSHRIFRVGLDGEDVTLVAGTGAIGEQDGPGSEATFTFPNGIATGPQGDRLYVNDFINRFPPTIEVPPIAKSTVRQLTLPSLSSMMLAAYRSGGIDAMRAVHESWKKDPATSGNFTEIEVNALGYGLMQAGQLPAATAVFEMNVEAYPNAFNTYDSLAEAYLNAGDTSKAIEFYRKSLALNPANSNATAKLKELGAER